MRTVDTRLLEEKMDEAVTHYINSQQSSETVHVDASALALNIQDDNGRVVVMQHGQGFTSQMTRQISVGESVEGPWSEELIEPERLAALVAHLSSQARAHHHQSSHHKVTSIRGDVDTSVVLDSRLFNAHLDGQSESIVVQVPSLPPLPPLQDMKRCSESNWFHKEKGDLKDEDESILRNASLSAVGEVGEVSEVSASPSAKAASKKSLPHKKRISRKLKRNTPSTPLAQEVVVINCGEEMPQEQILPDNFVSAVPQEHLPVATHHMPHEIRAVLICQLCGEFYGSEQLKFYHHLKQHYEPSHLMIDSPPVPDLAIDKMTNTCIVDNVAALPDSIVELSLENTVPKHLYPIDKHIMYTSADKALYSNKVQYTMASMDKEPAEPPSEADKVELYDDALDKLELYSCMKCNKQFRRQKHCEAHIKEAHSSAKLEDMGEFSEPEDLMEGIHVAVGAEEGGEGGEGGSPFGAEQPLLPHPHLTVDNGHVHQEHVRHWYVPLRPSTVPPPSTGGPTVPCGADGSYCPVCPPQHSPHHDGQPRHDDDRDHGLATTQLKEEVLQRILESEVQTESSFNDNMMETELAPPAHPAPEPAPPPPPPPPPPEPSTGEPAKEEEETDPKKKVKKFECPACARIFLHRNSLLYHLLSHSGKQHACADCDKTFYTAGALKVHSRLHNGDKPYKCEECGREFRQWSDLKYHRVSLHSNQKLFKCEFCGKEFARKYSLNVHRRIHTGEKNYKCDYCSKSFRASSYRLSHMRTHTGDRPYKCETCEKCFRVAGDLRRHMLTHEKLRQRNQDAAKSKDHKHAKDIKQEKDAKSPEATEEEQPPPKTEKAKSSKKGKLKNVGAPNVTITGKDNNIQFKINTDYANNEVFDTRPQYKFNSPEYKDSFRLKQYSEQQNLKDGVKEREFAILKPMLRNQFTNEGSDKTVYTKVENTDGKLQVFTQVEKSSTLHTVTLNDIRNLERERAEGLQSEPIESGFLERLTALYNIPA